LGEVAVWGVFGEADKGADHQPHRFCHANTQRFRQFVNVGVIPDCHRYPNPVHTYLKRKAALSLP
jgi:hypothetical protein